MPDTDTPKRDICNSVYYHMFEQCEINQQLSRINFMKKIFNICEKSKALIRHYMAD